MEFGTLFEFLNLADIALSRAAIGFNASNPLSDLIVRIAISSAEARGLVPVLVLWYLWFKPAADQRYRRFTLASVLCVTVGAIALGRGLANFMPFRPRPLASPEVMGAAAKTSEFLGEWSSMPSDHAIMFLTFAGGIFLVSRPFGILLMVHGFFFISLARVLKGMHYPGDIIVGAIIGLITALVFVPLIRSLLMRGAERLPSFFAWVTQPQIGYLIMIYISYQFITVFHTLRQLGKLADILKNIL